MVCPIKETFHALFSSQWLPEFSTNNNINLLVQNFELSPKKQNVRHYKLCVQRVRQPMHYLHHTFQTKKGHFHNFVILERHYKCGRREAIQCKEEGEWEKYLCLWCVCFVLWLWAQLRVRAT